MGKAEYVENRNLKAWIRNPQSVTLPQIDKAFADNLNSQHPLDRPRKAKLTIMMQASKPNTTDRVVKVDYATVRRLYNVPFIDHDKPMTSEQFIGERRAEAKEIIVNLFKRQYEEESIR
jgi:hypothetical protein